MKEEWSEIKRWNPFNSYKLLAHLERWQYIDEANPRNVTHPALVTLDPINVCNLKCEWCNSNFILENNKGKIISYSLLLNIADFLANWQKGSRMPRGVRAVCIAGGGEPLLHLNLERFIKVITNQGVEVGVVTNGTEMEKCINGLAKCTWVGVSIDCGEPETYFKIKGKKMFSKVIKNIMNLLTYSSENKTRLSMDRPGYGVTYKYLLHPLNINEVRRGADVAKQIGCKNFHVRPCSAPWNNLENFPKFTDKEIFEYHRQLQQAREMFEDENFGVYGVTHKFGENFEKKFCFSKCYAIFMTGVIMPGEEPDTYTFGLCCDRRGDKSLELVSNSKDPQDIARAWGSPKHWEIFQNIDLNKCPRCTYQPHNQIYEQVILNDSMTWRFI